jgi:uncharacterized protein involved in exopolysaccharide biosynthesis
MAEEITFDPRRAAPASSPTMRDLLAVLFRQWRLVLVSFAVVFLAVLLYGLLSPSYQAEMKILVRRGRVDPPITPQPTTLSEFSRMDVTEEELNSEVQLLRDEDLLRKVVLATGLDTTQNSIWKWRERADDVRIARAVRALARHLTVEPIRKTRLIAVRYDSSDPALAARVLNTLGGLYMEKHLTVHRPSGEFRFFEQQTDQYRRGLETATARLLDLNKQGVVAAALERDIALQKLSDADAASQQVCVSIAEIEQRIGALQAQLASLPQRATSQIQTSDNAQLLEQLKSTLLTLQLKRTELLTKFQPSYRLVQEIDQQIAETKATIAAERLAPVREETTEKNPTYEWAESELEKAEVELSGLKARQAASEALVANYRARTRHLGQDAVAQQDVLRAARTAEENYLLYVRKREEARIGDALDARGILNVTMVEEPKAPVLPKRSPSIFALVGFLAAGAVSTGLAFVSDYLDPAFRTPEEVIAVLDLPVLASLPRHKS